MAAAIGLKVVLHVFVGGDFWLWFLVVAGEL